MPPTSESAQALTVRRLKVLVIVLALLNLLLGLFGAYLLRRVDREYSALLDESVPTLQQLRELSRGNGVVFRNVIAALVTHDPQTFSAAVTRGRQGLTQSALLRSRLIESEACRQEPSSTQRLVDSARTYESLAAEMLAGMRVEDTADGEKARVERLLAASDDYGLAIEGLSKFVAGRASQVSAYYSEQVRSRSVVVLGLAGLPFLLACGVVVFTVVVVIGMLLVFRHASDDAGP